jgi:hypothetical protein
MERFKRRGENLGLSDATSKRPMGISSFLQKKSPFWDFLAHLGNFCLCLSHVPVETPVVDNVEGAGIYGTAHMSSIVSMCSVCGGGKNGTLTR